MAINKGYLTCDRSSKGDEVYTPFYAVKPILEYIPKDKTVWCPFDKEWSAFVQSFVERGNKVIFSHIENGEDFFFYEPKEHYDLIVSNPPFSKKDEVLKRLYELDKPFAVLLPTNSIQGKKRFDIFADDIQILGFDTRVNYHTNGDFKNFKKGNHFSSSYFCRNVLPERLILKKLEIYQKPLK